MRAFKKKNSYTEHMKNEWDKTAHETFSRGFLHFSGYYNHSVDSGRTPFGEEINEKVRITLINGILNARSDLEESMKMISNTHGNTVIHYVFRPSEGWSKDLFNSLLSKMGYTSSYAQLLASTWREMIKEMGGVEGGGYILHYAHSIGAADTYVAKNLLSPEEQEMIHVVTLGSPSLIPPDAGFGHSVNYVSIRDGVCLLDPIGYIDGWVNPESNVEFLGSFWGIPLIDHTLFTDSYSGIIKDLGRSFTETHRPGSF